MALYKCNSCGEYLTELDVEFVNGLEKKEHVAGKCCKCIMGEKQLKLAAYDLKKQVWLTVLRAILPTFMHLLWITIRFFPLLIITISKYFNNYLPQHFYPIISCYITIGIMFLLIIPFKFFLCHEPSLDGYEALEETQEYYDREFKKKGKFAGFIFGYIFCVIVVLIGTIIMSIFPQETLSIIYTILILILLILAISVHVFCASHFKIIDLNNTDFSSGGSDYYETRMVGNTAETRKVSTGGTKRPWVLKVVTLPLWGPLYAILNTCLLIRKHKANLKKCCNPQLVEIYQKAYKGRERVYLSVSDWWLYRQATENYEEGCKQVQAKYGYMGKDMLEEKTREIVIPTYNVTIHGKPYVIIEWSAVKKGSKEKWWWNYRPYETDDTFYLCYKMEDGKICGKILKKGEFLYTSDTRDWMHDWEESGQSVDKWKILSMMKKNN